MSAEIITPPPTITRRRFWQRKPEPTPADKVIAKLDHIERENEKSVKTDHRFGAIAVVTIASAAMIGMSAESIDHLFNHTLQPIDGVTFVIAFVAVIVMNRALLAAARNIRRAESRGEQPTQKDRVTLYGVMAMEALSFGYMLAKFEQPQTFVQWVLLVGRSCVLPYATVYLEQQREMPIDPQDIGIQTEIAAGMGVLRDFVQNAYDRAVPTALKVMNYQAAATLTAAQSTKLSNMQGAAQVYEQWKSTGTIAPVAPIQLVDAKGAPLAPSNTTEATPAPASTTTPPAVRTAPKTQAKKPTKKPTPDRNIFTQEQYDRAVELLTENPRMSVRTLAKELNVPHTTLNPHMKEINATLAAQKPKPGPILFTGRRPPTPDETVDEDTDAG